MDEVLPVDHKERGEIFAKAHNRRGDALLLLGRHAEALDAFNAAFEFAPDGSYVLYNRGVALLRLNRLDEAKADFMKVLAARKKQPGARKLAAEILATLR